MGHEICRVDRGSGICVVLATWVEAICMWVPFFRPSSTFIDRPMDRSVSIVTVDSVARQWSNSQRNSRLGMDCMGLVTPVSCEIKGFFEL